MWMRIRKKDDDKGPWFSNQTEKSLVNFNTAQIRRFWMSLGLFHISVASVPYFLQTNLSSRRRAIVVVVLQPLSVHCRR